MARDARGLLLLAAGACAALLAAPLLFLSAPPAHGPPLARELVGTRDGMQEGAPYIAGSTATTLSMSAAAIAAVAVLYSFRRGASIARRASFDPYQPFMKEKKFAAGMIGGASAFSGQDYNFDPLCIGERSPRFLPWYREAELKHGRVCMLAWVGLVVPEFVRIPGPESCYTASVVDAHRACQTIKVEGGEANPLGQVLLFCGIVEALTTIPKVQEGITPQNAGDYRLGINFLPKDDAKIEEMKLKELKNGRLAMVAFSGAITQAVLSGNGFPWLYAGAAHVQQTVGIAASLPAAKKGGIVGVTKVAMRAEPPTTGGYKMSAAVPFLPASPALEGLVGEEDGFDPMGFSLAVDIRWLREAELKHARVCMLATVGWITTDLGVRVPGDPFQVSTLEAHNAMIKFGSMPHMLVWIGMAEFFGFLAYVRMMEGDVDRAPGDFGIRVLYPKDEQGQYDMQLKELRNGRLAMLAFSGIVTSAALTQSTWPFFEATKENRLKDALAARLTLCGVSHGRASHRSVSGAAVRAEPSASLPFLPKPEGLEGWVGEEQEFDPLGFADTYDMKWLRESEIKHGRVCMLACVGFYAQQYIAFPGVDVCENANDALYKSPPGGLAALLFLAGYIESKSYDGRITMLDMFEGTDRAPGDLNFGKTFLAGKSEEEVKTMKLKELNNGRLAMFAFGGMVHHNYVVKGPLFPLFPDGWEGPQGTWNFDSTAGRIISGQVGNEVIPTPEYIAALGPWQIMPK